LGFLAVIFVALTGNLFSKIMTNDFVGLTDGFGSLVSGLGIMYIGLFLTYTILYTLVYAGLKEYSANNDQAFSYEALKENLFKYAPVVMATIFFVVFLMIVGIAIPVFVFSLMAVLSPAFTALGVIVLMPFIFYYTVILSFMPYIRVEEEIGLMESFHRARYLIKNNWWSTFFLLFVAGLIAGIIAMLFNIPFYIVSFTSDLGAVSEDGGLSNSAVFAGFMYLIGLIGGMFTGIYTQIVLGLKYYDLVEKKDNTQLVDKIGSIGQSKDTFFENEGEY